MHRIDDPNTGLTIAWGIVGAILVFVIIVALQAFFFSAHETEVREKLYPQAPEELTQLVAQQQELLNSYRWIDEDAGIAAIPIERAMDLVVQDLNRRAPAAGQGERGNR